MYIAVLGENTVVYADQTALADKLLRCPGCKKPVFLKSGNKKIAHFSHYPNQACQTSSEGETPEHLQGKKHLYDWFQSSGKDVVLESYLPELKQRPDLLIKVEKGKGIAIEFQCSSLPIKRMIHRTESYLKEGYKVFWILGEKFYLKRKMTTFQKLFLTPLNEKQLVLLHYSVKEKELHFYSHYHTISESKVSFKMGKINIEEDAFTSIEELSRFIPPPFKMKQTGDYQKMHKELMRMSYHRTATSRKFFKSIYENQEDIVSIPIELYEIVLHEWMIDTYPFEWKYHCLMWVESFQKNQIITMRTVDKWMRTSVKNRTLSFYTMPLVKAHFFHKPVTEYLDVLTDSGVVKKIGDFKWVFKQKAKRFNHIREKENVLLFQ